MILAPVSRDRPEGSIAGGAEEDPAQEFHNKSKATLLPAPSDFREPEFLSEIPAFGEN